jgi:hypothetical protein
MVFLFVTPAKEQQRVPQDHVDEFKKTFTLERLYLYNSHQNDKLNRQMLPDVLHRKFQLLVMMLKLTMYHEVISPTIFGQVTFLMTCNC